MPTDDQAAATASPDVWDVVTRVHRRYQSEIAWKRGADPPYSEEEIERVKEWLAGVSYAEWFALVADNERLVADGIPYEDARWLVDQAREMGKAINDAHT